MRVVITIDCDNAAFAADLPKYELARILDELSGKVLIKGIDDFPLRDINGNVVGTMVVSD